MDPDAAAEFDRMAAAENEEVLAMELTWSEKIEDAAREKYLVVGQQEMLLRQLRRRFGPLPAEAEERVRAVRDEEELARLGERVLTAGSLEEMGLGEG